MAWPGPFYWLTIPDDSCDRIRAEAAQASHGWGAIPVRVRLGATGWETSLLPRDSGYVLPLKVAFVSPPSPGSGRNADSTTSEGTALPPSRPAVLVGLTLVAACGSATQSGTTAPGGVRAINPDGGDPATEAIPKTGGVLVTGPTVHLLRASPDGS